MTDDPVPPTTKRRAPKPLVLAAAAAAILGGVVAGAVLVNLPRATGGEAAASPLPSRSAFAEPTTSGTPAASTEAATPTPSNFPSATAAPSDATPEPSGGPIVRWDTAAVFAVDGRAVEVTDMTYAAGHFVAVGYREPDDQRGHVGPPIDDPQIWISADGRSWEQVELGTAFEFGHVRTVVALPDGSAVVYGSIDPEPPENSRSAAWRSTDGRTWTPLELSLPRDGYLTKVVGGPRGLISVTSISTEDSRTEEIWHSVDGANWRVAHSIEPAKGFLPSVSDWQAGPEGFVVFGDRYRLDGDGREDRTFVVASGDGQSWFEAPADAAAFTSNGRIASIGGDWVIAVNELSEGNYTGRATAWFSTNGLAWEERGSIEIPEPASPYEDVEISTVVGRLVTSGERLIASGSVVICCHGPWWAAGVWSSFDGQSWERIDFPEGTVVTSAAEHDGVVVLAGFDRARPEDEFRARAVFWIGERR